MRKRLIAAILMTLFAGCTGKSDKDSSGASGDTSRADKLGAATKPNDWTTEKTKSGIDGDTYTASRVYAFPERQAQFQVAAACTAATGVSELTIESYIGDPQKKNDGSAFLVRDDLLSLAAGLGQKYKLPVGRVKASDGAVTELGEYFQLGDDYNNRIKFNFNNPVAQNMITQAPGFNPLGSSVGEGDVNYAKLLLAALPMIIQVKNGAGEFELEIDKSKEIVETLESCGAGGKLLTDAYLSKAKGAEQSARNDVLNTIKGICLTHGQVTEIGMMDIFRDDDRWKELVKSSKNLSISLDCGVSAPDEMAKFNTKIDDYIEKARQNKITCNRDALVLRAGKQGVDNSTMWVFPVDHNCASQ